LDETGPVQVELRLCENLSLQSQSKFRLLVVRLGAMGDILHALPAITALRMAHPGWEIGWVVEPRWKALLAAGVPGNGGLRGTQMPIVDRLHFAATKQWGKKPLSRQTLREIAALRRELHQSNYDAVLDVQGAVRSSVIARMAGCRRVIGELNPREWPARMLFSERIETHGAHVIEQDIELASAIAVDALKPVVPLLPVNTEAEAWCDRLLAGVGAKKLALINPGAGWGAKRWPAERYAAVAKGLDERGMAVLVNAGPGEEAMAHVIEDATNGSARLLSASLDQLIAVTRRISLCVAGDTGPLHLACALSRPVVGIYGPTDPSRNGPFGTRFAVLRSPISRRDHSRHDEPEAGLLTITPEDVLRAADELLAQEKVG
jgi:heptosyltransferase I